jgi:hypothetical protein
MVTWAIADEERETRTDLATQSKMQMAQLDPAHWRQLATRCDKTILSRFRRNRSSQTTDILCPRALRRRLIN